MTIKEIIQEELVFYYQTRGLGRKYIKTTEPNIAALQKLLDEWDKKTDPISELATTLLSKKTRAKVEKDKSYNDYKGKHDDNQQLSAEIFRNIALACFGGFEILDLLSEYKLINQEMLGCCHNHIHTPGFEQSLKSIVVKLAQWGWLDTVFLPICCEYICNPESILHELTILKKNELKVTLSLIIQTLQADFVKKQEQQSKLLYFHLRLYMINAFAQHNYIGVDWQSLLNFDLDDISRLKNIYNKMVLANNQKAIEKKTKLLFEPFSAMVRALVAIQKDYQHYYLILEKLIVDEQLNINYQTFLALNKKEVAEFYGLIVQLEKIQKIDADSINYLGIQKNFTLFEKLANKIIEYQLKISLNDLIRVPVLFIPHILKAFNESPLNLKKIQAFLNNDRNMHLVKIFDLLLNLDLDADNFALLWTMHVSQLAWITQLITELASTSFCDSKTLRVMLQLTADQRVPAENIKQSAAQYIRVLDKIKKNPSLKIGDDNVWRIPETNIDLVETILSKQSELTNKLVMRIFALPLEVKAFPYKNIFFKEDQHYLEYMLDLAKQPKIIGFNAQLQLTDLKKYLNAVDEWAEKQEFILTNDYKRYLACINIFLDLKIEPQTKIPLWEANKHLTPTAFINWVLCLAYLQIYGLLNESSMKQLNSYNLRQDGCDCVRFLFSNLESHKLMPSQAIIVLSLNDSIDIVVKAIKDLKSKINPEIMSQLLTEPSKAKELTSKMLSPSPELGNNNSNLSSQGFFARFGLTEVISNLPGAFPYGGPG